MNCIVLWFEAGVPFQLVWVIDNYFRTMISRLGLRRGIDIRDLDDRGWRENPGSSHIGISEKPHV